MHKQIEIEPRAFRHISAVIDVYTGGRASYADSALDKYATITVRTGGCNVQLYFASDDLRAVSRALLDAAVAIDERQQVTA